MPRYRQWQHHGKGERLRHEHVVDVPERPCARNPLTLFGRRHEDLRVVLMMVDGFVVGHDLADQSTELDELLGGGVHALEDDELVPVDEFADLLGGNAIQVPWINPGDLRPQSLALHVERHRLPNLLADMTN